LPVISGEGEGTIIFKSGGLDSRLGRVTRPRVPTAPAASAIDRALVKSFGANLGKQSTGGHVIAFQAYTLEPLGQPKASALPLCPTAASKAVSRAVTKVLAERPSPEPLDWTADPARPGEHSKTGRRVPPAEFTSEVPLATIHSIQNIWHGPIWNQLTSRQIGLRQERLFGKCSGWSKIPNALFGFSHSVKIRRTESRYLADI
jgi:hypothetical protein